ncbi:MAG TPA: universal stress protein [Phenylobacterium sp.]|nr:universal stress protein [Phenylobacterium sp.]
MNYKTILVHAEPAEAARPRLATAAALARELDATLVGVGTEMFDWVGVSDPYGVTAGQWITVMQDQMRADLKTAKTAFETECASARREWVELMDPPAPALARLSRGADLIVTGGAPVAPHPSMRTADPADLALTSGRPVLVAPPYGGVLHGRTVVLAWKDSREARRAMTDALPFLQRAEEVVVVEVCAKEAEADAEARVQDVVRHLGRHGVKGRGCTRVAPADRVAVELNILAESVGSDLIVSGAYGHNRLAEWILGGVTYDLLARPERFVLLSH